VVIVVVQRANFSDYSNIRNEQLEASLLISSSYPVVIHPYDATGQLHSPKKKYAGRQIAAVLRNAPAIGNAGGEYLGPTVTSVVNAAGVVTISFSHAAGLTTNDGAAITNLEAKYASAGSFTAITGTIVGSTVTWLLASISGTGDVTVRYATLGMPNSGTAAGGPVYILGTGILMNSAEFFAAPFSVTFTP
jgi:hypothetical protein